MADPPDNCLLCDKPLTEETANRQIKGTSLDNIIDASLKRQDKRHLNIKKYKSINVHANCAKNYPNTAKIESHLRQKARSQENPGKSHATRSESRVDFDFANLCFICGNDASDDFVTEQTRNRSSRRILVRTVTNSDLKKKTIEKCSGLDTKLAVEVTSRIERVSDLVEVGAKYHDHCQRSLFHTKVDSTVEKTDTVKAAEFISKYVIDNKEECQFSIKSILETFDGNRNVDIRYLNEHLYNIFGSDIIIHPSKDGHIISYIDACSHILTANWHEKKEEANTQDQRDRACTLAGQIISEDIRKRVYNIDTYPAPENFLDNVDDDIPPSLRLTLEAAILKNKEKPENFKTFITTISHIIIAATRPRSFLSPILIGLGAMIDKLYGSKELVQTLNAAGLCASYDEIRLFEASLLLHSGSQEKKEMYKDAYIQMVFDNADHDVRTIDGKNTFHVEGGIEILTPGHVISASEPITRLKKIPKSIVLGEFGKNNLQHIEKSLATEGLKNVEVLDLNNFREVNERIEIRPTDFLWMLGKLKYPSNFEGWNGFMERITQQKQYAKSKVLFLPFINNPPSDYDTLYTALRIADDKRKLLRQADIFVTFDEPQFRKSRQILQVCHDKNELLHVHTRLGGLHTLSSFFGSIDFIMDGSGIRDLFCQIYAENSVDKILVGHAYSRAVRAHTLAHLALGQIMQATFELTSAEDKLLVEILNNIAETLDATEQANFRRIYDRFLKHVDNIRNKSPTAKLWVLYYDLVTLVKQFIEAERSGNWELHLDTLRKMLPFFHASGHFKYAESAQIYVQDMCQLKDKMNETEYEKFVNEGYFTIRRSEKYYCGIWSDMAIEQISMRCMKTRGGLPALTALTEAVQTFFDVSFASSEPHVDARPSRIERDCSDLNKLLKFFTTYDPFPSSYKITCITSGLGGNDKVNAHNASEIGIKLMQEIVGRTFGNLKFKRVNRIVSLQNSNTIQINNKDVVINSNLIFQRIIVAMEGKPELPIYFQYELAPHPLSIFDNGLLRKTNKAKLYESFTALDSKLNNFSNVIDGGLLMHKVVWPKGETFDIIMDCYVRYAKQFTKNSYIVFDGYPENKRMSTKNVERQRRQSQYCTTINFESHMQATVTQEKFFSNESNKKRFIEKLQVKLQEAGFRTKQASEDADTMIVQTAIELASDEFASVIVAEDVDILIILSLLTPSDKSVYLLKLGKGNVEQSLYDSNSFKIPHLKHLLGFIHAFCGSDTTSAFYQQSKSKIIKILNHHKDLMQKALIFNAPDATKKDIVEAGIAIIAAMYSMKLRKLDLNQLRYRLFKKKSTNKNFKLASLPPTEPAAVQHLYRVYYQVQQWFCRTLDPTEWGWTLKEGKLMPVYGPVEIVPKNFLKDISCSCKKGCNSRCSCVKHRLKCSEYCAGCHGQTCDNINVPVDLDLEDIDEEVQIVGAVDYENVHDEAIDDECMSESSEESEGEYESNDESECDDRDVDTSATKECGSDSDSNLHVSKRARIAL